MKQRFIENKGPLSFFRLSLFRIGRKSSLGNPLFRHLWSGKLWERYEYEKNERLRITGYGFREFSYPNTEELIRIAVNSPFDEEIAGASRLLFQLEHTGKEYREQLLMAMEQNEDSLSKKRFEIIYEHANLGNYGNLRDVMHKTDEEVTADLKFYQDLFKRAETLKARLTLN